MSNYWEPPDPPVDQKPAARERFRNVIKLAGYSETAQERILEEYFEQYWNGDRKAFFDMMKQYEEDYKKDGEIV